MSGAIPVTCSQVFEVVEGPVDECGVCHGDSSSCLGCDDVPNSGAVLDVCGECGGDGCVLAVTACRILAWYSMRAGCVGATGCRVQGVMVLHSQASRRIRAASPKVRTIIAWILMSSRLAGRPGSLLGTHGGAARCAGRGSRGEGGVVC